MRKIFSLYLVFLSVFVSAQTVRIADQGIRYCESTYPYNGGILVANFGTEELNPLNTEGKGYVVWIKDGFQEILIPADGCLSAPKGMFEQDGYLYLCDVNKLVVYNLNALEEKPQVIVFPEGNLFVNDLAADGKNLYVSVTNTDRIFRLDISNPGKPGQLEEWLEVPGPNGLLVKDGVMYVASYPADGKTQNKHVVYRIENLDNPKLEKQIDVPGQYDGLALSSDGKALYVTNWTPAQVYRLNLTDGSLSPLKLSLEKDLTGPADISVLDGVLYIPDLPNSRVLMVKESSLQ